MGFFEHLPANIRFGVDYLKTSYKRLSSSSLQDVFKASWSRRLYSLWSYVFRRRLQYLQDVLIKTNILALAIGFKIFSRRLKCVLQKRPQDIFKTSCQNVFKASSKTLQGVLQRYLQDASSS